MNIDLVEGQDVASAWLEPGLQIRETNKGVLSECRTMVSEIPLDGRTITFVLTSDEAPDRPVGTVLFLLAVVPEGPGVYEGAIFTFDTE